MVTVIDLIPHRAPMLLLDRVIDSGPEHLIGEMQVSADKAFVDADGNFPAWAGIELLAQAVAAYGGLQARANNRAVQVGFLLGTRRYEAECPSFAAGSLLQVQVRCLSSDEQGFAIFEGRIEGRQGTVTARINVLVPTDLEAFMHGSATPHTQEAP